MTRKVVAASLAAGALVAAAAAGVVAIHRYRQGHSHTPEDHEALDQLESHLELVTSLDPEHLKHVRFWSRLKQSGASSPEVIRRLLAGLRNRSLDDDQTSVLENDLDTIENHAGRQDL